MLGREALRPSRCFRRGNLPMRLPQLNSHQPGGISITLLSGGHLIALVDTNSFWIAGYFKETQLPHIQVGQKAIVTLMGHEDQPFQGAVRSVGWGVYVQDGSSVATGFVLPVSGSNSTALLPSVSQTIDWVRLPQRFPVRIKVLGNSQVPLLIGQTVSVAMIPEVEPADITKQLTLAQP